MVCVEDNDAPSIRQRCRTVTLLMALSIAGSSESVIAETSEDVDNRP